MEVKRTHDYNLFGKVGAMKVKDRTLCTEECTAEQNETYRITLSFVGGKLICVNQETIS